MYKTIIIAIAIAALIGCVIWWYKDGGWEPKVASLTALLTVLTLSYDLKKDSTNTPLNQTNADTIANSPITGKIETQNNYYVNPETARNDTASSSDKPNKISTIETPNKQPSIRNEVESKNQHNGVTANEVNPKESKAEEPKTIVNKASSTNQKGGITANTVNIYTEKPSAPPIELLIKTLNGINPKALDILFQDKRVCVLAQQAKMTELMSRRKEVSEFVDITPGGNIVTATNSRIGDCINDVDDYGMKDTYEIKLKKMFKK